ncbi:hypothetical protein BGW38_009869, partial [Lunasporangiospora selenospora]
MESNIIGVSGWEYLGHLASLLERFDYLTTLVSASVSYATIPFTIFVYNELIDHLEDFIDKHEGSGKFPDIVAAAKTAREKMLKYYAETDLTPIYSIATAMHPNMRFSYWNEQDWEAMYQKAAQEMVRTEWALNYANVSTGGNSTQPVTQSNESS